MDWIQDNCEPASVVNYVLGTILCVGGTVSYIPQYISLIRSGQPTGISELSLLLLNVGSACLAANSFILNYYRFECYHICGFWLCTGNLLSLWQILVGWLAVLPLYAIFLRYKIRTSQEKVLNDIMYGVIYAAFIAIMVIVGVTEKEVSSDSRHFFSILARIMGITSAIASFFVWIPQIVKLLRTKQQGSLSLAMFLMQTPGNIMIIVLQILFRQNWTTWITYIVILVEQLTIVIILLVLKYKKNKEVNVSTLEVEETNFLIVEN